MDINRTAKGFTFLAPIYDYLAEAVFQGRIIKSQSAFFNIIAPDSKILILAGGTGRILRSLDALGVPLYVDFVDISEGMLRKAKKIKSQNLKISFWKSKPDGNSTPYDVVMIPFYFDMLNNHEIEVEIADIKSMLSEEGKIIFTDFRLSETYPAKVWQSIMLTIMYLFFSIVTGIKVRKLPPFDSLFARADLFQVKCKEFYGRFIMSKVYQVNS